MSPVYPQGFSHALPPVRLKTIRSFVLELMSEGVLQCTINQGIQHEAPEQRLQMLQQALQQNTIDGTTTHQPSFVMYTGQRGAEASRGSISAMQSRSWLCTMSV